MIRKGRPGAAERADSYFGMRADAYLDKKAASVCVLCAPETHPAVEYGSKRKTTNHTQNGNYMQNYKLHA